ncbi:hypothetical protein ASPZODRAFT_137919 [Penicilliopsis zonata CBS 506.65]|uniref:Fungal N-terminal domain-containing protein n=1 Tax=Penicilliopsis zonata CBS 506.65 TaxID=1073090 RepID=A0A1L9SUI2_9EURO|nr:hypothetical protein ASPZODRAFT_137919 [Penicilliopsis zonata CBS 506.65]OJJ50781.1 hypothetical protein ASPZODRAFT_137919 [Penicilliopsis zonata CBS 506.65]
MTEALGVAESVAGILSLAGQICSGIQELYAFIDSIRQAETEYQIIKEVLMVLDNVVHSISEDCAHHPDGLDAELLQKALELCSSSIQRLIDIVRPRGANSSTTEKKSSWRSLVIMVKKQRLNDF